MSVVNEPKSRRKVSTNTILNSAQILPLAQSSPFRRRSCLYCWGKASQVADTVAAQLNLQADGNLFKTLASTHNATLYVESRPAMAIRAEATSADLEELGAHMHSLTKVRDHSSVKDRAFGVEALYVEQELVTASIQLPGALAFGDAVLQAMSRRAGTYIEQAGPRIVGGPPYVTENLLIAFEASHNC